MSAGTAPGLSPRGDYDLSNPVGSFVDVVRRVVVKPAEFFSRMPRRGTNAPLIFALICIEISTILGGLLRLTLGPQVVGGLRFAEQMGYGVGKFIAAIIFTPIGATIGLFIGAGILHLFVMLFVGEGNSGYEATFRVISYASVTSLVNWIPVVGGLLGLYGLYLTILGIREMHATTTARAALVLVPVYCVVVVAGVIFLSRLL